MRRRGIWPKSIWLAFRTAPTCCTRARSSPRRDAGTARLCPAARVQAEDGGGDATLLAVRAVELLRDLQLEVAQVADDDEDPTPLEPFSGGAGSTGSRWYLWGGGAVLLVPWTTSSSFDVAPGALV